MADAGKLLLRLGVAVLLLFHGIAKIRHGVAWMAAPLHAHHLPAWVGYGVYLGEVVAPLLLIAGVLTRPAALIVAFNMVMAIFLVLGSGTFALDDRTGAVKGELALLYMLAALAIVCLGSGRFAISRGRDRWD